MIYTLAKASAVERKIIANTFNWYVLDGLEIAPLLKELEYYPELAAFRNRLIDEREKAEPVIAGKYRRIQVS